MGWPGFYSYPSYPFQLRPLSLNQGMLINSSALRLGSAQILVHREPRNASLEGESYPASSPSEFEEVERGAGRETKENN